VIWEQIKAGEFRGFSVEGMFKQLEPVSMDEELINKKLFRNIPYIELSSLYIFNNDLVSSIQTLNEIKRHDNYSYLSLMDNYRELRQNIPKEIEEQVNKIDYQNLQGLGYQTILANYYFNIDNKTKAEEIFTYLNAKIEDLGEDTFYILQLASFYNNYGVFLNYKQNFTKSVEITNKSIDFLKTYDYLNSKHLISNLRKAYNTHSLSLLGSEKYNLLEQSLKDWRKLGLIYDEETNDFLYITARLQEETGNYIKAIENFLSYLKHKNDPYANFHLGRCYLAINKNKSACIEFEKSCKNGVELACRFLKIKCDG
jgi:tetratricopeptide (TPR) repeat protein